LLQWVFNKEFSEGDVELRVILIHLKNVVWSHKNDRVVTFSRLQYLNLLWSSWEVADILVRFLLNVESLDRFFLNLPSIRFHGNPSYECCADIFGETDRLMIMTKVIGVFRDCAHAPDISLCLQAIQNLGREWENAQLLLFSLFDVNFGLTFWFR
jgi:hypothetical protein